MSASSGKRPAVKKGQPKLRPIPIRHAQPQNLPAPSIDSALIADPSDNTVKVEYLEDDGKVFRIAIPAWDLAPPESRRYDTLTVQHVQSGAEVLERQFNSDDAAEFPLPIVFDRAKLEGWLDGVNSFDYKVLFFNGVKEDSGALELRFDRKPPYDKANPAAFPVIADITDANIATVKLSLPAYPDRADGDKVHWFWLNEIPAEGDEVDPDGSADVGTLPQDIPVPAGIIEARGDGGVYALYVLTDKAGNISRISVPREVGVAIGPLPGNLKDPVVDAAADGVIDQQDVFEGVNVRVLAFDNAKSTDQVRVIWGSDESEWRDVGRLDNFPMDFGMAPKVVWESYGASSTGEVAVPVAYEVRRGTVPQGRRDIKVKVNLERIGPVDPGPDPDPDWPNPVNPRLPLPAVYGEVSDTENVLLPDDEYEDARLTLVIDDSLQAKDQLMFYWGDAHLDTLDHLVQSRDIGEELEFEVPWAAIAKRGNDIVPVHYTVNRPGNPNAVRSDTTAVVVTAIGIHPEKPAFLGGNTEEPIGWLTCGALYDKDNPHPLDPAIRVQVPDLAQYGLKAGDTVTLKWTAVHGFSGDTEIPGVRLEEDIPLTEANINGFVWRVRPYEDHILPIYDFDPVIRDGRGRVEYTFKLDGQDYPSEIEEQVVSMHGPSGPCPLNP